MRSGYSEIDGSISVAAGTLRTRSGKTLMSAASGKAHLRVEGESVSACAGSIGLNAERGFGITRGDKTPVLMWSDVENVAERLLPILDRETEDLSTEKDASAGFNKETLDKMIFGFRKSVECRTERSWVIGGSGDFKMYEPAWLQVMKVFETLMDGKVEAKTYKEDAKWSNGRPFPGENAENSGLYVELPETGPQNLAKGGMNVPRHMVKSKSAIRKVPLKDGYKVRK